MKIRYKKKIAKNNLILGIVWLVLGVVQIIFIDNSNPFNYAWLVFSAIYLAIYFNTKNEYLTIKNSVISQNWPLGKKMNINEIMQIHHFAGEYILKSDAKKFKINIDIIEKSSLEELKTELKKLNAEWN